MSDGTSYPTRIAEDETPIDEVIDVAKRGGLPICLALVAEIESLRHDLKIQRAVVDLAYLPARNMTESRDRYFARAKAAEARLASVLDLLAECRPYVQRSANRLLLKLAGRRQYRPDIDAAYLVEREVLLRKIDGITPPVISNQGEKR